MQIGQKRPVPSAVWDDAGDAGRISVSAVDELAKTAPETATPFLRGIGRTLTARIRAGNKRYGDAVKFSRASAA